MLVCIYLLTHSLTVPVQQSVETLGEILLTLSSFSPDTCEGSFIQNPIASICCDG
jgi:hypothetical protein